MASRDYSSIYSIKDFFLNQIATNYFDVDDISLLNVGLFGMITDISGTVTEDQFGVVERYLNEIMPAKAELPDFIYANGVSFGVTDFLAKVAKAPFIIFIRENDVINNGEWEQNTHTFKIDSDLEILIDEVRYSIPHDLIIKSTIYKGAYTHSAYYDTSTNNDVYNDKTPYVKVMKVPVNGEIWLILRLDIYQYIKRRYTEKIITNNILNIPYIEENYSDYIANFEVFYRESGSSKLIQLEKRMETAVPVTTPFVYYKVIDNEKVRFSFANDDRYFVPGFNSTLVIEMYESQGKVGNFKYTDNDSIEVTVVPSTEDEQLAYLRGINMFGYLKGDSDGGTDQLTDEEIKRLTLEKMVSISSYTTDNDLNLHYSNYGAIYHNDSIFVKYRDDVAGREYGCFSRLTDDTDIYPTNTLDMRFYVEDVDNHFESLRQYIIKPGHRYGYLTDTERSIVKKLKDTDPVQEIEYTTMPLTVVTLRPNSVNYYQNSVDKSITLDYAYLNAKSVFNFLASDCTIYRNALKGDDTYIINLSLTRTDGITTILNADDETSNIQLDPTKMKVLMVFSTDANHYIEFTYSSFDESTSTYNFTTSIKTTDMIDAERIQLLALTSRDTGVVEERIIKMHNPDVSFSVFYQYDTDNLTHDYTDIPVVANSTLCNTYKPYEDEFYFAYPLSLMRSHVVFEDNPGSTSGWNFYIKQVPLFGRDWLMSLDSTSDLLTDIVDQHEFLMDSMSEITALFTINMKFYNTYGRSKLFYLADGTLLNRVNCNLSFQIKFYDGIDVDSYLYNIKVYIKQVVEQLNLLSYGSNKLYISKLIQRLHESFDQIEYITFKSINNYNTDIQNIILKNPIDSTTNPDTVPEFLTLKVSDISITTL